MSYYSEQYPLLKQYFDSRDFKNFEILIETIHEDFGDLFNLNALEQQLHHSKSNYSELAKGDSHFAYFEQVSSALKHLYTKDELIYAIYKRMTQDKRFEQKLIFIAKVKGTLPTRQLGLLEKIATGTFKVGEPLTFVDMLRSLNYLTMQSRPYKRIGVVRLAHLTVAGMMAEIEQKEALFINVNRDLKGIPKWAVVNLKLKIIYCETPLLEGEKSALDKAFGHSFTAAPEGDKANSLESTGYSATAWLDQNLTKAWNFDVHADLATQLEHLILIQIGGDNSPKGYNFIAPDEHFFSDGIKHARDVWKDNRPGFNQNVFKGAFLVKLANIASNMQWDTHSFPYADISEVLALAGQNKWTHEQLEHESLVAKRKINPGFSRTIIASPLKLITETDDAVKLTIPLLTDDKVKTLYNEHKILCSTTSTNPAWFFNLARGRASLTETNIFSDNTLKEGVAGDIAAAMVLTLICAKAKKEVIKIHLPEEYQLNAAEQKTITGLLQNNAFVTQLEINANASLVTIKKELGSILARNRWLHYNGYKPPMFDDYWRKAARYWLLYVHEQDDVLADKAEHERFKDCVENMGLEGLRHILMLLSDTTFEGDLEKIYELNRPAFYAACCAEDFASYVTLLLEHLEHQAYFPFSELGIAYQHGAQDELLRLISALNDLSHPLKQLQLVHCFKTSSMPEFELFLEALAAQALHKKWVGLIHIPELSAEKTAQISEQERRVRAAYSHLNNIILKNRRDNEMQGRLDAIKKGSSFELVDEFKAEEREERDELPQQGYFAEELTNALGRIDKIETNFPLSRGGAVQLQLQQQQQLQQSRQTQQEHQQVQTKIIEQIISGPLVTYDNITDTSTNFYSFYQEFIKENDLRDAAVIDRQHNETVLQGFFRTWISANPDAKAPYVIHSMTQEAAKVLLRKHNLFTAGVNLDNLPRGFYTQQAKAGALILCYDPEVGYLKPPTPLTLNLGRVPAKAIDWEGDFRQFNPNAYAVASREPLLNDDDVNYLMLFALLQPARKAALTTTECQQFAKDIGLIKLNMKQEKQLNSFYPAFVQAWQYKGNAAVNDLFNALANKKELKDLRTHLPLLLAGLSSEKLKDYALSQEFSEQQIAALGQLYYHDGSMGLELFLTKLQQIHHSLGDEFFKSFSKRVLIASVNYKELMSVEWFQAIDDMITMLKPHQVTAYKNAWSVISSKHIEASVWDSLSHVWRAFEYFINGLNKEGIELKGDEFDGIMAQNMLVAMDRILASLRSLTMQEQKQAFIQQLATMQLQHGGVHYAIVHDGFKYFDKELALHDFTEGDPSYLSDLAKIYQPSANNRLKMQRILAAKGPANEAHYKTLKKGVNDGSVSADDLVLLLSTHYEATQDITTVLKNIQDSNRKVEFAHCLHNASYRYQQKDLLIDLQVLLTYESIIQLKNKSSDAVFLEALTLLERGTQGAAAASALNNLCNTSISVQWGCSEYFNDSGIKLVTLYGQINASALELFLQTTTGLLPVVENELKLLFKQLLSIDFAQANHNALRSVANWQALINTITQMQAQPHQTSALRLSLLTNYTNQAIHFKYSKTGDYRALVETDAAALSDLDYFPDHKGRLWLFLKEHVAVPGSQVEKALKPLMCFFKNLQMSRTQINEIEPLLSMLTAMEKGRYWTANYLLELLRSLETKDMQGSYPMSLLKVLLEDGVVLPKAIDEVETNFPAVLTDALRTILENTIFTRQQQSLLCKIALHEYKLTERVSELGDIMGLLAHDDRQESRSFALAIFVSAKNMDDLKQRVVLCRELLSLNSNILLVNKHKTETAALWLKALSARNNEGQLFADIGINTVDAEDRVLILHIMAYSCLRPGLRDLEVYQYELDRKSTKLLKELLLLDNATLQQLAHCYPQEPSPGAGALLRILKQANNGFQDLSNCIEAFLRKPHTLPRKDYGRLALVREGDFMRMLRDSRISKAGQQVALSAEQSSRLSIVFSYLKSIESGDKELLLNGKTFVIAMMSQSELAAAFIDRSEQAAKAPENDVLRAEIWAILFEVLARTTNKYPHMAQQFSLIANDIGIASSSRVLQLATGEGKSHFVALRAARLAGLGDEVEISTAKRSLAERDREDYAHFYAYLGLNSAYIHPLSDAKDYTNSPIRYSTLGDLSLFLDEQNFNGHPINRTKCIGLFDEFDFIRFDEGVKTEYNYARPTGRTPKQMTWFYQVVNKYYAEHTKQLKDQTIDKQHIKGLIQALAMAAEKNEERQIFLSKFLKEPVQLVQWLQSAHDAATLEWGKGFTVRAENIDINGELIPMQEIIPLSSDNQRMHGSTFSAGVQQLLAVRLNEEAKRDNKPQNFHIPMESRIISSQVANELIKRMYRHWEGFSGTISALQAKTLYEEQETEVLHVPTNKRDRRNWHTPSFHDDKESQLDALIQQLKQCLANKKSILFSCKNDKAVQELETALEAAKNKGLLDASEFAQLMFYTNEDKRSAAEVLAEKLQQEGWTDGKKTRAIGLVASGFGRGDNVGVEAVFLFDVSDKNDLMQKGGRTARNGAEGEVFQFYVTAELRQEYPQLITHLAVIERDLGVKDANKEETLELDKLDDPQMFEEILYLRERISVLQNAANMGYHHALAQFTAQAMELLAQGATDQNVRQQYINTLVTRVETLDKQWVAISGKKETSVQQKITEIEEMIAGLFKELEDSAAQTILPDYNELFTLRPYELRNIKQRQADIEVNKDELAMLTHINSALAAFTLTAADHKLCMEIPPLMTKLAQNQLNLSEFTAEVEGIKSISEFHHKLVAKVANNPVLNSMKENLAKGVSANEFSTQKKYAALAQELMPLFSQLGEELTALFFKMMKRKNVKNPVMRIKEARPILDYVVGFSSQDKKDLGANYIGNMEQLIETTPQSLTALRFSGPAISYESSRTLWKLFLRCRDEASQDDMRWHILQKTFGQEERLQQAVLLEFWESWSADLEPQQASSFLLAFCQLLSQCTTENELAWFHLLIDKTNHQWTKKEQHSELLLLWSRLAERQGTIFTQEQLLNWAFSSERGGKKAWLSLLLPLASLSDEELLIHGQSLQEILPQIKQYTRQRVQQVSLMMVAGAVADLPYARSKESIMSIITNVSNQDLVKLLLAFRLQTAKLPAAQMEKLQNSLPLWLSKGIHQCMTMQEVNAFLSLIDHALARRRTVTPSADVFVEQLLGQLQFIPPLNGSYFRAVTWYVDFVIAHPLAHPSLNTILPSTRVAFNDKLVQLETLSAEISLHDFSDLQWQRVFACSANQGKEKAAFSVLCTHYSQVNTLLKGLNLSREEKARASELIETLSDDKLPLLLAQLALNQEKIVKHSGLLERVLSEFQRNLAADKCLVLAKATLAAGELALNHPATKVVLAKIAAAAPSKSEHGLVKLSTDFADFNLALLTIKLTQVQSTAAYDVFAALNDAMRQTLLTVLSTYLQTVQQNPATLLVLLDYARNGHHAEVIGVLAAAVLTAFDNKRYNESEVAEIRARFATLEARSNDIFVDIEQLKAYRDNLVQFNNALITLVPLDKNNSRESFGRLDGDQQATLLNIMASHRIALQNNPEVLPVLLHYFETLSNDNAAILSDGLFASLGEMALNHPATQIVLATTASLAESLHAPDLKQLSTDFAVFNATFQTINLTEQQRTVACNVFASLDEARREIVLCLLHAYQPTMQKNPETLLMVLEYAAGRGRPAQAIEILAAAVLTTFDNKRYNEREVAEIRASFATLEERSNDIFVDIEQLKACRDNLLEFNKALITLVALDKNNSREAFDRLGGDKQATLLEIMAIHRIALQNNAEVLPVLLHYFETLSNDKAAILSYGLLASLGEHSNTRSALLSKVNNYRILAIEAQTDISAQELQQKHNDLMRVDALLENMLVTAQERGAFFAAISALAPPEKLWFFRLMNQHAAKYQSYPEVIRLLTCELHFNRAVEQKKARIAFFVSNLSTEELIPAIRARCFDDLDESTFGIFATLCDKMPMHIDALLFDQVPEYISTSVHPRYQQIAEQMLELFYSCAKEKIQPAAFFNEPKIKALFDFDKNDEVIRNHRIIWMHLLNAGAFVRQADDEDYPERSYQWRAQEENAELLQLGFDAYLTKAKNILGNGSENNSLALNRNFSDEQRIKLLGLSHELLMIGQPMLELPLFNKDSGVVNDLNCDLSRILNNYNAGWFKSTARTQQLNDLKNDLAQLFNDDGLDARMYQRALGLIQQARHTAMTADIEADKTRFFKLNRSGSSRYLNTLNQLEDMLIRKWVANSHAVHSFQQYRNTVVTEFEQLKNNLSSSIIARLAQLDKTAIPNSFWAKADRFFSTNKELETLSHLLDFLESEQSHDIGTLGQRLAEDMTKIPGHLRTLANEVLFRSKVLASHTQDEELQSVIKIFKE